MIELEENGLLVRGRPSPEEAEAEIARHVSKLKAAGIKGPSLGELRKVYLEAEFEQTLGEAVPGR